MKNKKTLEDESKELEEACASLLKQIADILHIYQALKLLNDLIVKTRAFVGEVAWRVFLWSKGMTDAVYWNSIYEQERDMRKKYNIDLEVSADKAKQRKSCGNCGSRIKCGNEYVYACSDKNCHDLSGWKEENAGIVECM